MVARRGFFGFRDKRRGVRGGGQHLGTPGVAEQSWQGARLGADQGQGDQGERVLMGQNTPDHGVGKVTLISGIATQIYSKTEWVFGVWVGRPTRTLERVKGT